MLQLATKPRTQDVLNPMFLNNVLNKAIQLSINSDDKYADNLSFLLKFFPKSLKLMGKSLHNTVKLFTHFVPMEFPIKFDTFKSGWSIVYIEGSQVIIVFLSLKIDFVLANSADPDEMPQFVAFHLGLHCFPKDPFNP